MEKFKADRKSRRRAGKTGKAARKRR